MFRKNFVVVGGGTAGWITALYIKKLYHSDVVVTVIESPEIGILGAGEGTTPSITSVFAEFGIDYEHFMRKTNATHKMGVSFENWNGNNDRYFHSFNSAFMKYDYGFDDDGFIGNEYVGYINKHGIGFSEVDITTHLSYAYRSPILKRKMNGLNRAANFAFHFDAHLTADYLKNVALKKNVKLVQANVTDFVQDSKGNIKEIILDSGKRVYSDFVFDCTGFNRLIIGKLFKSPWKSYMDSLKVNTAIPFQLKHDSKEIFPYTRAIAMNNGWMWQIPLQNRIGSGYVFDSNYITPEEAQKEVEQYLGHEIEVQKVIKFDAGVYEKTWINNCIAIGLSTGFTEPIEATSIFSLTSQLWFLSRPYLDNYDDRFIEKYNDLVYRMNDSILDFLYFHYITKRTDTPFWKDYVKTTKIPDGLQSLMKKWDGSIPENVDFNDTAFGYHGWLSVGSGLNFFDKNLYIDRYENFEDKDRIQNHHDYLMQVKKELYDLSYSNNEYLNNLTK